jgi:hypothetical protein
VKSLVATFITAALGVASTAGYANTNSVEAKEQSAPLLLIGPVESVSSTHTYAVVLGQKVLIGAFDQVTVGETKSSQRDLTYLAQPPSISRGPYRKFSLRLVVRPSAVLALT